jgi:hypothetical protein
LARQTCVAHLDGIFIFEESVGSSHRIIKSSTFTKA